MQGYAAEKDGKVVQVSVDYGNVINSVKITGDFFIHPEEGVIELEEALKGFDLSNPDEKMLEVIKKATKEMQLVGIRPETLVNLIRRATCGE